MGNTEKIKVIDTTVIDNLMIMDEQGDGSFLKEIAELYLEQMPSLVNNIKTALKEKESKTLVRSAHNLKGASMNLGAVSLAAVCKKLEDLANKEDFDAIKKELTVLDEKCGITKNELQRIINF